MTVATNITYSSSCNNLYSSSCFLAEQWLAEVTYKPGWSFSLVEASGPTNTGGYLTLYPGVNLVVNARTMDSNTLGDALFVHTFPLSPESVRDRETFLQVVLECVKRVEIHEAMEFLKALGERIRNPHPSLYEVLYE